MDTNCVPGSYYPKELLLHLTDCRHNLMFDKVLDIMFWCHEHYVRSCDDRMIQKVHQTIGRHSDVSAEAPALQLVKYICKVTMETVAQGFLC